MKAYQMVLWLESFLFRCGDRYVDQVARSDAVDDEEVDLLSFAGLVGSFVGLHRSGSEVRRVPVPAVVPAVLQGLAFGV